MIKTISVYLGSSEGKGGKYVALAREVGRTLARKGIKVVYGGAEVGTMKALADGVLEEGGYLVGVFPNGFGGKREVQAQNIEILCDRLSECILVRDFAERKATMEALSECALVLPGSVGTMDELFCYGVNNEIGLHDKKVYVLNYDGYYDGLRAQLETFVREGFIPEGTVGDAPEGRIISFCSSLEEIL